MEYVNFEVYEEEPDSNNKAGYASITLEFWCKPEDNIGEWAKLLLDKGKQICYLEQYNHRFTREEPRIKTYGDTIAVTFVGANSFYEDSLVLELEDINEMADTNEFLYKYGDYDLIDQQFSTDIEKYNLDNIFSDKELTVVHKIKDNNETLYEEILKDDDIASIVSYVIMLTQK